MKVINYSAYIYIYVFIFIFIFIFMYLYLYLYLYLCIYIYIYFFIYKIFILKKYLKKKKNLIIIFRNIFFSFYE